MDPKQLSEELRQGKNPHMTRRRWTIGLSMLGGSMGQAVTLYQTGIVNHLPDPPGQKLFDADRVDASNYLKQLGLKPRPIRTAFCVILTLKQQA